MRALVSTAPDDIRTRFAHHTTLCLVTEAAGLRPRIGEIVDYTTRVALRQLGRRATYLADQIDRIDQPLAPLVAPDRAWRATAPPPGSDGKPPTCALQRRVPPTARLVRAGLQLSPCR